MLLSETFFYHGQPLGKICQNSNSGYVTFVPLKNPNSLVSKKWATVRACRRAVIKTHKEQMKCAPN